MPWPPSWSIESPIANENCLSGRNWAVTVRCRSSETTSIGELRELWTATAQRRNDFLSRQSSEDLQRTVTAQFRPDRHFSFTIGDSMLQLGGHGTHHRAQLLNMLRHLGTEPPALDYLVWLREEATSPA